ncbi:MAG: bifunctional diaminohydroxyphosphoribosylaminopyrimidine deaminase/5-amino-6-(5-phosphoribosylamino)uracil reductase RibD [Phycisphaerales bacterium]
MRRTQSAGRVCDRAARVWAARERVIGIGHHRRFGGPHAEVDALKRCQELGNDPRGATAYVTLEPCNGHGKNPPCVMALVEAGIARVVCAARDVTDGKGNGSAALRAIGIPCEFTDASRSAIDLSEPWRHRLKSRLPWVVAKWAQTIDGKLATASGLSKWISNDRSRVRVHRIRSAADAVMVGGGTVEFDDPTLTVRDVPCRKTGGDGAGRQPLRVVVTPHGKIAPGAKLVQTARTYPTLIVCDSKVELSGERELAEAGVAFLKEPDAEQEGGGWLRRVLVRLRAEHGVHSLMVEGGAYLLGSLLHARLVNELHVHTGPRLLSDGLLSPSIGGAGLSFASIDEAPKWRLLSVRRVGDDVQSVYRKD